ncbi:MAG: MFS family permease [Salinirussus sp.]|jgi:MFS family permease
MRERRRALVVTATALFLSVLVWFNYSAVLPQVVEAWGLTGVEAGVVFGAFQAGYLVAVLPAGRLADSHSPRWLIAVGAAGTALPSLAFAAVADGVLLGAVLRFLSGVFVAGVYVPGMRFLSDWFPESVRGRALGVYIGTFELGSGLSFVFATTVAAAVDWRLAVAVTSVGALAVPALVLGLTRDAPDRREMAGGVDRSLLRNRRFLAATSIYAWHNWELFGVRNWLLAFLAATPALGGGALPGLIVGVMVVASGAGNVAGGWLSDRIDRTRVLAGGLVASGLLSATFGLLGGLPLVVLTVVTVLHGFVLALDSAPTSTLITEVVADRRVGSALSVQSLAGFSTTVVSPVVFGLALDRAGYALAFPTLALGAGLGLLSVVILVRLQRAQAGDTDAAGPATVSERTDD